MLLREMHAAAAEARQKRLREHSNSEQLPAKRLKPTVEPRNLRTSVNPRPTTVHHAKQTNIFLHVSLTKASIALKFSNGALRLSATPGRRSANTIRPDDLVHSNLISAFFNTFQHGRDEWFRYLPREAEIYHGSFFRQDPVATDAIGGWPETEDMPPAKSDERKKWYTDSITSAQQAYHKLMGPNFHAVFPMKCVKGKLPHSKIMVMKYPTFLRVVITSANFMEHNFTGSDNVWFIQDFPLRVSRRQYHSTPLATDFQDRLLQHIKCLGAPNSFIASVEDKYDLNSVKISLILSCPGTHKGRTDAYGLLRLNSLVQTNGYKTKISDLIINSCTGSTGALKEEFLRHFHQAACGRLSILETDLTEDMFVIVYPTKQDVENSIAGKRAACEQGSIRSAAWNNLKPEKATPDNIKRMFHHYESKDYGRLFHAKQIFPTLKGQSPKAAPLWMYIGSANLSASAWGKPTKPGDITSSFKIGSYECGIFIRGEDIAGMIAEGDWDEIVPFQRPAARYSRYEKPWNHHWKKDK
ncbi:tyrosyl-DNA phosphodiesterase-domain-containing protein [Mycena floridula]|nr:tyrosyl-DNA phosphodiesterase-domain-containing protein [Mycena floridula]